MATPKGMKHFHRRLATGDSVLIYSNRDRLVLQLRHETPTEENLLDPSFKVAVELSPADALAIAHGLLPAAVPRFSTNEDQDKEFNE